MKVFSKKTFSLKLDFKVLEIVRRQNISKSNQEVGNLTGVN